MSAIPAAHDTERYPNFDLLRLLLASEVVYGHARYFANPNADWPAIIMAVPAFLAISGFLVLKSYADSGSFRTFMKKRGLRLLPALALSMIVCLVLLGRSSVYNSMVFWLSGGLYAPSGNINVPLWSLAWEELAYLSLALLWMAGAYKRAWIVWTLFAGALYVVYSGRHLEPHTQIILFLGPAFLIGNLCFLHRGLLLRAHPLLPWAFLGAVIFAGSIPYFDRLVALSPVVFQAFSIVWVGMAGFRLVPIRFPDISYGLYIYHMPLMLFLVQRGFVATGAGMALWLPVPLLMLCLGSWYLVEKPALRLKKAKRLSFARATMAKGSKLPDSRPTAEAATVEPSPGRESVNRLEAAAGRLE